MRRAGCTGRLLIIRQSDTMFQELVLGGHRKVLRAKNSSPCLWPRFTLVFKLRSPLNRRSIVF
jgi:hypothetical protein